ncbi:hypothetical protein [Photobacterium swingsii]|uniref:hypothetical protein n=1 Tax=Photobacterium swingsii TaxID=680026 RepID=UPI004068BEB9
MIDVDSKLNILNDFKKQKTLLLKIFYSDDVPVEAVENESSYLHLLSNLSVSKLSVFSDVEWDYNQDVLNPSKSVQGSKLKIDFSKYGNVPEFVLIELKCLLSYIILMPRSFKVGGKNKKKNYNIKANTAIAQFKSGLRLLNHLFERANIDGEGFVKSKFKSLSDIQQSDYEDAAKTFCFKPDQELNKFFAYLKHPFSMEILGRKITTDFGALEFPEWKTEVRKERVVFENDDFEKLIAHSSFRIVEFLTAMGEEVEDEIANKHFQIQKEKYDLRSWSPQLVEDYSVLRLKTKGYPDDYIHSICDVNPAFLWSDGSMKSERPIRDLIKESYSINNLDSLRLDINEVYYSAMYIVGQYTAGRPNYLQGVDLRCCLISSEGHDLLVSNEKKGEEISFNLFDDTSVAIPILKDAVKAARILARMKGNHYLFSNADTVEFGQTPEPLSGEGIRSTINKLLGYVFTKEHVGRIKFMPYMMRHTLAYQLHRAELGLPFISFQLKHIVDRVQKYTSRGATSAVTLGYGEIADNLCKTTGPKGNQASLRHMAEIESVKATFDPDGTYVGAKASEHKARLAKVFQGYMQAGKTKEEIYEAMAEQGLAIVNVGTGFCFGGREDFDESLPCIGSLRCNPNRCSNSIITKSNAPKWREIYFSNRALLADSTDDEHKGQLIAVINEAESVLKYLGEEVIL